MSSSPARVDPFASLDDFTPSSIAKPKPEVEAVRKASEDNNFVSRAPAPLSNGTPAPKAPAREQRRHRTGRNVQVNIKTTRETVEQLQRLSDANKWVFGETLARALQALEAASSNG